MGTPDPYVGYFRPKQPGVSCCGGKDCRPAEARYNFQSQRTEVFYDEAWRELDLDVVIGPPPPGTAQDKIHICISPDHKLVCVFMGGAV